MIRLEFLRRKVVLTRRELGRKCNPPIASSYIYNAERNGARLSEAHAQILAVALGWKGDPDALNEEIYDMSGLPENAYEARNRYRYSVHWGDKEARNNAIRDARKAGMTFRDIGVAYGITKQRAHQICMYEEEQR